MRGRDALPGLLLLLLTVVLSARSGLRLGMRGGVDVDCGWEWRGGGGGVGVSGARVQNAWHAAARAGIGGPAAL